MSKPRRKRSITIAGHRTSISLEEPFWEALCAYAAKDGTSLAELVSEIDKRRGKNPTAPGEAAAPAEINLSAAIRLYVLERMAGKA
jgi:predicted DNA-binding ribbon-helix-helix protein